MYQNLDGAALRLCGWLFGTICLVLASTSSAAMRIVITGGVDVARPIAILPFKVTGDSSVPQDVASIIADDLANSGRFKPIELAKMSQIPSSFAEVDPTLWRKLGVEAVIIGQITKEENGQFLVSYQLINTADLSGKQKPILEQNKYRVEGIWLRHSAHTISDMVFERLTGVKGAFRTRMAYVVHLENTTYPYELRVADYDGHNSFMVFQSPAPIMSVAWAPDGRRLAYVTFEGGVSALMLHDVTNNKRRRLSAFPRHNGAPAFSFDGKEMALALSKDGSLKVYRLDLASGKMGRLTEGMSNDTEPAWHPDGKSIIFTSDRSGHPEIYQLNLLTGQVQRLTWEGGQNQCGKLSPDGRTLVMVNRGVDGYHIAKQDLVTGSVTILTETFLDETPTIAPNSTMIVYGCTERDGKGVRLVSMDGRVKRRLLTEDGQVKFPAWSPYLQQ